MPCLNNNIRGEIRFTATRVKVLPNLKLQLRPQRCKAEAKFTTGALLPKDCEIEYGTLRINFQLGARNLSLSFTKTVDNG
ncbi:MAG: hypothetical protein ABL921_29670 [Pirellula sp.]